MNSNLLNPLLKDKNIFNSILPVEKKQFQWFVGINLKSFILNFIIPFIVLLILAFILKNRYEEKKKYGYIN